MKRFIGVIGLCLSLFTAFAQVHLTDAQRDEQIMYIRQDTLPVSVEALPPEINTRFSEYSPVLISDSVFYFTSMRADNEEDFEQYFETSWYCYLYQAKCFPDGDFAPAEPLPSIINKRNVFNSNFCFHPTTKELVFSRCVRNKKSDFQCSLWQSTPTHNGWSKPKKLPNIIQSEGSTSMQPCWVAMPDYDILYFVSNRKNGFGGFDIWYAIRKDGKFEEPVNAGSTINTEGNEITPFYDKEKGTLYFSSNEHLGIGDYDIFYSAGALSQWGEVSNMGVPFNSPYNDFYYNHLNAGKRGFFSSNRPHDYFSFEDTCCNDIFQFQWIQPEEENITSDSSSIHDKIAAILPITLYFQNDQPNPRTTSDTTTLDYPTLYNRYVAQNGLYVSEAGKGFSEDTSQRVRKEMMIFLRDSVATGYGRLLTFTRYLKEALSAGDSVKIQISGFASPLHNSDYNQHLSSRRIISIINYLHIAEGGFFKPYLEGTKPGLIIQSDPQGAVNHAFSSDKTRETVYGVQAAKDRKIVISQ